MSCKDEIIIGATPEDRLNYGETIELLLIYKDENKDILDLSDATVSIFSSVPAIIKNEAEVEIIDGPAGKVRFLLRRDHALLLQKGKNNWFRMQAIFGAVSDDITPNIFLQVS